MIRALSERPGIKIGSVVIDCIDFEKMFAFWREALHYESRRPPERGWVILYDPDNRNTCVSLNQVLPSEKLYGRNWLHFDLYTADQKGEIERLLSLGAKMHPQEYDPEEDFRVLEDPDGNLFCVVDTTRLTG
jgi:Glyoxalase-like domain